MSYVPAFALGAVAVLWILSGLRIIFGMAKVPRLAEVEPEVDSEQLSVSILVAARDEAEQLGLSLPTLLAQDYPDFEVVVVDDRSTDETPRILDELAEGNDNLTVIHLDELPEGWLGKCHALSVAFTRSRGDWLVFADADVRFAPDAVRRAVALVQRESWDHLGLLFQPDLEGFWEKTVVGYWFLSVIAWFELWRVADPNSPNYIGSGAFTIIRRGVYEAIGTHRRLAMEVVEDLKLGKLVKEEGYRSAAALAGELVRLRWYAGLRGIVDGFTKNGFAALDFRVGALAAVVVVVFLLHVGPWLGVLVTAGLARAFAAAAVLVILMVRFYSDRLFGIPPVYALTHPLGTLVVLYILVRSAVVTLRNGGISWRGTFYPLDELRKGLV